MRAKLGRRQGLPRALDYLRRTGIRPNRIRFFHQIAQIDTATNPQSFGGTPTAPVI